MTAKEYAKQEIERAKNSGIDPFTCGVVRLVSPSFLNLPTTFNGYYQDSVANIVRFAHDNLVQTLFPMDSISIGPDMDYGQFEGASEDENAFIVAGTSLFVDITNATPVKTRSTMNLPYLKKALVLEPHEGILAYPYMAYTNRFQRVMSIINAMEIDIPDTAKDAFVMLVDKLYTGTFLMDLAYANLKYSEIVELHKNGKISQRVRDIILKDYYLEWLSSDVAPLRQRDGFNKTQEEAAKDAAAAFKLPQVNLPNPNYGSPAYATANPIDPYNPFNQFIKQVNQMCTDPNCNCNATQTYNPNPFKFNYPEGIGPLNSAIYGANGTIPTIPIGNPRKRDEYGRFTKQDFNEDDNED